MVWTKEEIVDIAKLEELVKERSVKGVELERVRAERDPQEIPQAYFDILSEEQVGAFNVYYRHNNTGEHRPNSTGRHINYDIWGFTEPGSTQSVNNYASLVDCNIKLMEKYPNENFRFMPLSAPEVNPGKETELLEQGYQLHEHKPINL